MALTYTAIATVTVGSGGAADMDFTSIPGTYTDLLLKASLRGTTSATSVEARLRFNGDTGTNYRNKYLGANGASAYSGSYDGNFQGTTFFYANEINGASSTASTFSNFEFYIPNYTSSNNKSISLDGVMENNATTAYSNLTAQLWINSSAITSIKIYSISSNLAQYSTATLYGIKNTV